MVEVSKPDYLSLVNKGGSGFNVSELVTAMVAAEIEPKRGLQQSKLEKTENAISGLGYLNSQVATTQKNFSTIASDNFFNVTSSNSESVSIEASDETKLVPDKKVISDITIAKKMVFELGNFANLTDTFTANVEFDRGTWSDGVFAASADNVTQSVSFAGETLPEIVAKLNEVSGIKAQIIDTTGDGSSYSLILTGVQTGQANGFNLTETTATARWSSDDLDNSITQYATNAEFKLDGVEISRDSNTVVDIIEGAEIVLNSDIAGDVLVDVTRSEEAIRQTLNDVIFSLNEFKTEMDRLTYIDIDGGENGPLAMETSATILESKFKKLSIEPLTGYGSNAIYLSQLGIKTNSSGEYYLDEVVFSKTLENSPSSFMALKDANLSSSSETAIVSKSQFTNIPSGTYTVSQTDGAWTFGETELTQIDLDDGGSQFTSTTYPGLVVKTSERIPDSFEVYVGKSFSQKIIDLMDNALDLNSSLKRAEETYSSLTEDIEERLSKLEEREKLISSRYTEQFGSMEQSMSQFNSTKSLLENFVESWKKQK